MTRVVKYVTRCGCERIEQVDIAERGRPRDVLERICLSRMPLSISEEGLSMQPLTNYRRRFLLSHQEGGMLVYIEEDPDGCADQQRVRLQEEDRIQRRYTRDNPFGLSESELDRLYRGTPPLRPPSALHPLVQQDARDRQDVAEQEAQT